ncbi:enoyl-CoA hydratase-related protein, partial [Rhizobiaceae sp. 2RAB30]
MGVIGTTVAAGIRRLALSDPEGRNALDAVTRAELATELRNAFEDPEVRAIVVGSDARNFSTGGNLADVATHT